MATTSNPMPTKLQLKLVKGVDPVTSANIYTTKTFGSIRVAATDDKLRLTAMEIAALQELPIEAILRVDTSTLVEG